MKHLRKGKDPEVDTALNGWFGTVTSSGQKLSGPMLKEKAEDLAKKLATLVLLLQRVGFHNGRHDIKLGTNGLLGRREVQTQSAEEWISSILPELLEKHRPNDVYNADETGLYY